jgi:hemolysin D
MLIVPRDTAIEVEAFVHNKDIGFIQIGQQAEIKVETFPFTRYGAIDAEISHISNDAIADENLGLVYAARVLMKKSVIQVGERLVNLTPGMSVTVEVKTGKRRLIEFIMSPLLRYRNESMRER